MHQHRPHLIFEQLREFFSNLWVFQFPLLLGVQFWIQRFVSVKEMRYEVCFNTDQLVDALEVGRRELLVGLIVSAFKHWQVPMSVPAEIQGILWESGH